MMDGLYIERVTVTGEGLEPASIDFVDGLNVVSGASDTGKSYLASVIDFALGSSRAPRSIDAARGYSVVTLAMRNRSSGMRYRIERPIRGGRPTLHTTDADDAEEITEELRLGAGGDRSLNTRLLRVAGFTSGLTVRKNAQGERKLVSFRDLAHLCIVDEARIISERPPHLSDNRVENTAQGEVLRLVVTGQPDEVTVPPAAGRADPGSRREAFRELVADLESQVAERGLEEAAVRASLPEIDEARSGLLVTYESATARVQELQESMREDLRQLRAIEGQDLVVDGLERRFGLLQQHYESDLTRLDAIAEAGTLLEQFPLGTCPVCGAQPAHHQPDVVRAHFSVADVRLAAEAERSKTSTLNHGLESVLDGLAAEHATNVATATSLRARVRAAQEEMDGGAAPTVRATAAEIRALEMRRDEVVRDVMLFDQIADIRRRIDRPDTVAAPGRRERERFEAVTTAEMEDFVGAVEALLQAWRVPETGRVVWSEQGRDLVVGGEPRSTHGKGVRALTCSAFITGLMRHCSTHELAHPGFVVLDSPLVAYKDPRATDRGLLMAAGVKDAFYRSLAAGDAGGQVIILENEFPPDDVQGGLALCHEFTKTTVGRYGFIPIRNEPAPASA